MNESNEILKIILVEYWFISWPIILIGIIISHYFNKKRFKEEDILLNKMGFNRTTESLNLNLPRGSGSLYDFYKDFHFFFGIPPTDSL